MAKKDSALQKSEFKDSGFYRLIPPTQSLFEQARDTFHHIILLPYYLYQIIIGRLLSYLVINPLFRKETNEAIIQQHPKHPDPLFTSEHELSIINIYPKKHVLIRMLFNWHNFFVNHTTTAKIINSIFSRILNTFPSGRQTIDTYLDKLVDKVAARIDGSKGPPLTASQIHFRGMEYLTKDQQETLYKKLEQRFEHDFRTNKSQIYCYSLQTTDNAILDSIEIRTPEDAHKEMADRHFIIAPMPRSNNYMNWVKNYAIYAKQLNVTVITFNYRGAGLSTGIVTSEQNLYDDTYAQVQRLRKLGVPAENIALMGECLGANVATHTAGTLHEEGERVKLYNARSFRSLNAIIEERRAPSKNANLWYPTTWAKWLGYGLVKAMLLFVNSAGWSMNIEKKFAAINPEDRDYLVVRSQKSTRFFDDLMVPHKTASIHSLVKQMKKEGGKPLSLEEREELRSHKFYVSEALHKTAKTTNGHVAQPRLLVPTFPQPEGPKDGREYALSFFKRIWASTPKEEAVALAVERERTFN